MKLNWRQETSILIPPGPRSSGGLRLLTAPSWACFPSRKTECGTSFLRLLLQQGLANCSMQVESWFCRKRSLERGPALSRLYLCGCFPATKADLRSCDRDHMAPEQRTFTIWSFTESLSTCF